METILKVLAIADIVIANIALVAIVAAYFFVKNGGEIDLNYKEDEE